MLGAGADAEDTPESWASQVHRAGAEKKGKKHIAETSPLLPKKECCREGMEITGEGSSRMLGRTGIHGGAGVAEHR